MESALDHIESRGEVTPDDATLASLKAWHTAEDERLHRDFALLADRRPGLRHLLHLTR